MAKEKDIEKILGTVIKDLRLSRGLSQEKLAELGDFERSYISKVENGLRAVRFKTVIRFAKALNIKSSELVKLVEEKVLI